MTVDPYTNPDHHPRHILVVRENGDFGTEHSEDVDRHEYDPLVCSMLQIALSEFAIHNDRGDNAGMHLHDPGRYWVDVDDIGNLEIGSRLP